MADRNIRSEATASRIDWSAGPPFANWRRYVGPAVRAIWHTFTEYQKIAIAQDADTRAKDAEYE